MLGASVVLAAGDVDLSDFRLLPNGMVAVRLFGGNQLIL